MRSLSKNIFFLSISLLIVMLAITSCDRVKGSLAPNQKPSVEIKSYRGTDLGEANADIDTIIGSNPTVDTVWFKQTIRWDGQDFDGNVVGYAYRLLNKNWEPISVPGHMYINAISNHHHLH